MSREVLADRYDGFLLDLDGTLYRGEEPILAAIESVSRLHREGRRIAFLTNNSGRTREQIASKLRALGIEARADEVVSSALATAELLASRGVSRVFGVCGEGLREELAARGIEVVLQGEEPVDAVVVGFDPTVDYERLRVASLLVQRGAPLVASNADAAYPAPDGLWPGAGAILSAIVTTTGATPEIVGKPNAPLFEAAREVTGAGEPLVVGDRLDTDIAGAAALGWDTLLVLSGITRQAPTDGMVKPTYVAEDLSVLFAEPGPTRLGSG